MIKSSTVKRNILISLGVQVISLMSSFLMNLIVPKFISELQYSYWQTYILYVGYVGVLHFGLLDGIVLRYSEYDYEQIDKCRMRSQFQSLLIFNSILMICGLIISSIVLGQPLTKTLLLLVSIGIVTKNIFTYSSYTFQITNRIDKYAILIISQKAVYITIIVSLLLLKVDDFIWYCMADLVADVISSIIGSFFNKGMYFGRMLPIKENLQELKINISAGILLMFANWASGLILGSAKMIVQWHWDTLVFGKISFSFSVSSLFLTFVTAISVVLFPSLKRMDETQLPKVYQKVRSSVSMFLFFAMIGYFPVCWILQHWLPKYNQSLVYLGMLLPLIIYTSKVSLLTNNYLKVYRKEKSMMIINVVSVVVGIMLFAFSAYILDNLSALLICIILVVMVRSILSEIIVMKIIKIKIIKDFIIEFIMTGLFIIITMTANNLLMGFVLYSIVLVIYSVININNIKLLFSRKN